MELQFEKIPCPCLYAAVREVQNQESTQEIKLSDAMPDIGRIIGCWGQLIARGKEWRGDGIAFSGGLMAWVLYAPEDGSPVRCLDTWMPFQMKWDLPPDTREGEIRVHTLLRSLDARSVSPRKIMVRAGIAAQAEALAPMESDVFQPGEVPEDVQLLQNTYPVRLPREAGEKTFLLDEELTVPGTDPKPDKLMYYSMGPQITDRKVMANKIVFRGNGNLHILYTSEDGYLHTWDFAMPFSQFAELNGEFGSDAGVSIVPGVTSLDLDLGEDGKLRVKCGIVAQYVVDDRRNLTLTEDAYSPERTVEMQEEVLALPMQLDSRQENIYGEQTVPGDAERVVDAVFLPDFPRQRTVEGGIRVEIPGQFQVLFYGEDGTLQSGTARWEDSREIPCADSCRMMLDVEGMGRPQVTPGSGAMTVGGELQLRQTAQSEQGMPMAAGLRVGEKEAPDPMRPTLILRRSGGQRLWDIAKSSGSTVAAIRSANGLKEEPEKGQMLLIPVS